METRLLVYRTGKIAGSDHLRITERNLLRLNTFGRLFVERDGVRLAGAAAQPRRLGLLALLAEAGERGVSRDRLLLMLWAESDEERARKGLNQALYALRQELGGDEVILGSRELRLDSEQFVSDLGLFAAAIRASQLERAVAEYHGPFLDGFHLADAPEFERWAEEERAGLARDYAGALQRLARQAAEGSDPAQAVEWWRRLAAQDPLNAQVAVGLMQALVAAGDPAGALKHARVHEVLLQQELEAPPDAAVLELARRIREEPRADRLKPRADEPEAPASRPPAPASRPAIPLEPPRSAPLAEPAPVAATAVLAPPQPRRVGPVVAAWGLAAMVVLLAGGAWTMLHGRPHDAVVFGRTARVTADAGVELHPALSPDGRFVAFTAGPAGHMRVYVRQLAGGRTIPVAESVEGDQHWPRWSPDGARLGFTSGRAIYVVPALGGPPQVLVTRPEAAPVRERAVSDQSPDYLSWSPDGRRIAYALESSIEIRPVGGGAAVSIPTGEQPHSCTWSPDGSRLACVLGNAAFVYAPFALGNTAPSSIVVVPVDGGPMVPVTDASALNTSPVWVAGGRGLFFVSDRDGSRDIYRVALDRSARPVGDPVRLTTGLEVHTIDLSRDSRVLVYARFTDFANIWVLPLPPAGNAPPPAPRAVTSGHQSIEGLALAPGGRWLAFDSDRGGRQAIYRVPVDGGEPEPLSADSGDDFMPAWSPDAREIAYYGFREGRRQLLVLPADGGSSSAVAPDSSNQRFPDWSPDGRHLVFHSDRSGRFELYVVDRRGDRRWGTPRQLTTDGGQDARWSPLGDAVVYVRDAGLWLVSPSGGPARQLMDAGDPPVRPAPLLAQWAPDGRTIYYKALGSDGSVSFWSIGPEGGEPKLLGRLDPALRPSWRAEFATDGKRFFFTTSERDSDIWQVELAGR